MIQNPRNTTKVTLRGKFIVIKSYLRKQGKSQKQSNLHIKEVEKEEQTKLKVSRKEKIHKDQNRNK